MHKVEVECSYRKFLVLMVIVEVDAIAWSNLCMRRMIRSNVSVFCTNEQNYVSVVVHLAIFEIPLCKQSRQSFFTVPLPIMTKNTVVKCWRTIRSIRGRRITVKDVSFKSLRRQILSLDWLIYSLCKLKGLKYLLYAGVSFQAGRQTLGPFKRGKIRCVFHRAGPI